MKNIVISIITIAGLLLFTSCEDSVGPTLNTSEDGPVLTSHEGGESFELNEDEADQELMTLSWEAPDFGFSAAITYIVEADVDGSGFEDPATFVETDQTSISLTVGEVNSRLLSAGVPPGTQSEVNMRIRAHVNDDVEDRISETFMFAFTPYEVVIDFPEIYVPGGYQGSSGYTNDWSPADAPPLTSPEQDDQYEGYVYIANDGSEFKFTADRTWDLNWGDDTGDGTLDENGGNITADAGYYKMNVDLNSMTYEIMNTDWGIIGDATPEGWDADQDMTYDQGEKVWTITVDLVEGEMKFRANDAWDLDYGDDGNDGTLEQGGANIPVEAAGNYTIQLNLSEYPYTYNLTQN